MYRTDEKIKYTIELINEKVVPVLLKQVNDVEKVYEIIVELSENLQIAQSKLKSKEDLYLLQLYMTIKEIKTAAMTQALETKYDNKLRQIISKLDDIQKEKDKRV